MNIHTFNKTSQKLTNCFKTLPFCFCFHQVWSLTGLFWNLAILILFPSGWVPSQVCFGTLPFWFCFHQVGFPHRFVLEPCHFDCVSTRFGLSQVCFGILSFGFCFHQAGFPDSFLVYLVRCVFQLCSFAGLSWGLPAGSSFPQGLVSHRFVLEPCLSVVFPSGWVLLQVCLEPCHFDFIFTRSLTGVVWNIFQVWFCFQKGWVPSQFVFGKHYICFYSVIVLFGGLLTVCIFSFTNLACILP